VGGQTNLNWKWWVKEEQWLILEGWRNKLAGGCIGGGSHQCIALLHLLNCCGNGNKFQLVIEGSIVGGDKGKELGIAVWLFQGE